MAAVSALPNGRGLRNGGSMPQDADAWDFAQRSSPEVRFLVELPHVSDPTVLEGRST